MDNLACRDVYQEALDALDGAPIQVTLDHLRAMHEATQLLIEYARMRGIVQPIQLPVPVERPGAIREAVGREGR